MKYHPVENRPIVEAVDLTRIYPMPAGPVTALRDVSIEIRQRRGEDRNATAGFDQPTRSIPQLPGRVGRQLLLEQQRRQRIERCGQQHPTSFSHRGELGFDLLHGLTSVHLSMTGSGDEQRGDEHEPGSLDHHLSLRLCEMRRD